MTDDELHGPYRDVDAFLVRERSPDANVEPVSQAEAHGVRRMLAVGRSGYCNVCGERTLHLHAEPADG